MKTPNTSSLAWPLLVGALLLALVSYKRGTPDRAAKSSDGVAKTSQISEPNEQNSASTMVSSNAPQSTMPSPSGSTAGPQSNIAAGLKPPTADEMKAANKRSGKKQEAEAPTLNPRLREFALRMADVMPRALESGEQATDVFAVLESCIQSEAPGSNQPLGDLGLYCFYNAKRLAAAFPDSLEPRFSQLLAAQNEWTRELLTL